MPSLKNKSHLTAIHRPKLPTPVRYLIDHHQISGRVLDYGCGKCAKVNQQLCQILDVDSVTNYDPYFAPMEFRYTDVFDTILCNYVLCVLPEAKEKPILEHISSLLSVGSVAFITVRNDVPKQGYGYSKRGTYQRKVELPLDVFYENSNFRIYMIEG